MKTKSLLTTLVASASLFAIAASADAQEPTELTWLMWSSSDEQTAAWQHVADLVNKQHPEITVELQTTNWADYWTKLPTLAASGQLPDIVSLQSLRAPGFAQIMDPLNPYIEESGFDIEAFDQSIIDGLSKDGSIFALPYDFGPIVVYYNKDRFEEAGVPLPSADWTYDEFLSAARALTTDGKYGFAVTAMGYIPFALSAGANYLTEDGELNFEDPKLQAAFQQYADLAAKEKVAPVIAASGTMSNQIASGRFQSGDVAMFTTGPWELINQKNKTDFTIGLAPIPAGEAGSVTTSAGSGFGIAKDSDKKEEAWKAIQILTGPEAEQYLASAGRAFTGRIAEQKYWYENAASDVVNAKPALEKALEQAVPYTTTTNWNSVEMLHEQYAPLAYSGSESGEEVLNTISTLVEE
ncbi:MAG: sugar ABC transporter substrate-binding protein [Pseudomonadota bacterium]